MPFVGKSMGALPRRLEVLPHLEGGRVVAVGAIRAWNMLNAGFHMPVPEVPCPAG